MQDLVPRPGIEPLPSALGAWSLNHWIPREVPTLVSFSLPIPRVFSFQQTSIDDSSFRVGYHSSPEKLNIKGHMLIYRKGFVVRGWITWLWRLRNPTFNHPKAENPEGRIWFQLKPEGLRTRGTHAVSPDLVPVQRSKTQEHYLYESRREGCPAHGENRSVLPYLFVLFSSVQFSCSVMSDPLWPHGSQHARPPCPSPTPGVYSNPCPSSWWCHSAISSSVVPFSSCPQSLPTSGSFPVSQLFAWGDQITGVSASASVLPMDTQDWSLGWNAWISLQSKGLSRVFSNTIVQKHQFFGTQLSSQSNSHIHTWPLEKP